MTLQPQGTTCYYRLLLSLTHIYTHYRNYKKREEPKGVAAYTVVNLRVLHCRHLAGSQTERNNNKSFWHDLGGVATNMWAWFAVNFSSPELLGKKHRRQSVWSEWTPPNWLYFAAEWTEYQFNIKHFLELSTEGERLLIMYVAACCSALVWRLRNDWLIIISRLVLSLDLDSSRATSHRQLCLLPY